MKKHTGIPFDELCALINVVTMKYGKDVLISTEDKKGHMHLTKEEEHCKEHLGYIDVNTGSLIWDGAQ